MRWIPRFLFLVVAAALALVGFGYWTATRPPVVREAQLQVRNWPKGAPPVRILLVSDIHVVGPDMPPSRLDAIVDQINALRPDAVLMAGDFISEKAVATHIYSFDEIAFPLRRLRAPLGVYAVLGNHDYWADAPAAKSALTRAGVRVLFNEAARAGPLAIGGLDDDYTGHADLGRTVVAMQMAGGVPVLLSHSPDPFPDVPVDVPLMVAGHTHCGQISLPMIGPLATASRYGKRYACGRVDERGRTLIVGAGVGTSILPLRLGAVPDMWLITLGPAAAPAAPRPPTKRPSTPSAAPETSPEKRRTER
jgi:predicted MPP superfamily phosphohydrolase